MNDEDKLRIIALISLYVFFFLFIFFYEVFI